MTLPTEAKLKELRNAHNENRVLGLMGISEKPVDRLDIDVFMDKYPTCFNLFLLAFAELKEDGSWMGLFQMAGIHGMPSITWDKVAGKVTRPVNDSTKFQRVPAGYCAHSVETFPTWHRPYLAMLEQGLYLKMLKVANDFDQPHRDDYMKAAQQFRLPYWDYYRPRGGPVTFSGVIDQGKTSAPYNYKVPIIFTESTIIVNIAPSNKPEPNFPNPLNHFSFEAIKAKTAAVGVLDIIPDDQWRDFETAVNVRRKEKTANFPKDRTVRYPTKATPTGDLAELNTVINEVRMDSNRMAMMMMEAKVYDDYNVMSSNQKVGITNENKDPKTNVEHMFSGYPSGSLEGLHGNYHGVIGGLNGHMSEVPIAAFDPIFWFHHCQIDRLFAIWQAIHSGKEDSWFHTPTQRDNSRSKYPEASDGLSPFRKGLGNSSKNCWSSEDSKTTEAFGYTYPDIRGTSENIKTNFRKKYEWSVPLQRADAWSTPPEDMKPIEAEKSRFFKAQESAIVTPQPIHHLVARAKAMMAPEVSTESPVESDYSREWFVDDEVERLALNGAFSILYFINEDPGSRSLGPVDGFLVKPSFAALTHIFAAPVEFCDNCGYDAEQAKVVTNTNSITSMLQDYVEIHKLQSLAPEHVKPFLTGRLRWRVVDARGELHDPRQMAAEYGLKIGVSCKTARLPRGSDDATYEEYPDVVEAIIAQASATATAA